MSAEPNGKARGGRAAAWLALIAAAAVLVTLVLLIFRNVSALLLSLLALAIVGAAGWIAVTRRGAVKVVAVVCLLAALAGGTIALIALGAVDELIAFGLAVAVFSFAARYALQASTGAGSDADRTPAPAGRSGARRARRCC